MLKVAVGHSNDPDSAGAIAEVLAQCATTLASAPPQAGVLVAAFDFDHALILAAISQTYPGIELIGGTTNGEISSILGFQQDSLTLILFASDTIVMRAGVGRNVSADPVQAAQTAIAQASAHQTAPSKLCLTFPEGLSTTGGALLDALQQSLGASVPIVGGMSADDYTFEQTYQFFHDQVLSDAVPVLVFSGDLLVSHGVASGWTPIGLKSRVTQAQGNVVQEIDGRRALDFYQHYLGETQFSANHAIHALAVFEGEARFYLRAPQAYDPESGSVSFFAEVPEQSIVQITDASHEAILAASATSLDNAIADYPGTKPTAALLISCASRCRILGTSTALEYQLFKTHMPTDLPCYGFYTYGEIAPLEPHSPTRLHHKTFVTLLLGEG